MECIKCGYKSRELKSKFNFFLCDICYIFSPNNKESFETYISEKVDSSLLETFRRHKNYITKKQKDGMIKKAEEGRIMSRAPLGYKIHDGELVPSARAREVIEIFEELLNENLSLSKIADKHKLSINGVKKILRNFTYIGKIKFNNQIYEGKHEKLISPTLFNKVQDKLERMGIK